MKLHGDEGFEFGELFLARVTMVKSGSGVEVNKKERKRGFFCGEWRKEVGISPHSHLHTMERANRPSNNNSLKKKVLTLHMGFVVLLDPLFSRL